MKEKGIILLIKCCNCLSTECFITSILLILRNTNPFHGQIMILLRDNSHQRQASNPVPPTPGLSGVLCCSRERMVLDYSDQEVGGAAL